MRSELRECEDIELILAEQTPAIAASSKSGVIYLTIYKTRKALLPMTAWIPTSVQTISRNFEDYMKVLNDIATELRAPDPMAGDKHEILRALVLATLTRIPYPWPRPAL